MIELPQRLRLYVPSSPPNWVTDGEDYSELLLLERAAWTERYLLDCGARGCTSYKGYGIYVDGERAVHEPVMIVECWMPAWWAGATLAMEWCNDTIDMWGQSAMMFEHNGRAFLFDREDKTLA